MSQIMRSWLAFAAIGASVIHLALVVSSPLALAIPLVVLGVAEAVWGVLILMKDRIVAPQAARAGALIPMVLWSLLVVTATVFSAPIIASSFRFIPMAVATLFELFIAGVLSIQLRRQADAADDAARAAAALDATPASATSPSAAAAKAPSAGVYLAAVFAGGLAVAVLTTPALSYTQAGIDNPHAEHAGTSVQNVGDFTDQDHTGH